MVRFKNTRDVGGWEAPDMTVNLYDAGDFGEMGMTERDVDDLAAFLMTVTDAVKMAH